MISDEKNLGRDLIFTMAEVSGDKRIILKCRTIELTEIFDEYCFDKTIKEKEYDELINIVEQFKSIAKNFKKGKKK